MNHILHTMTTASSYFNFVELGKKIAENGIFLLQFLGIVAGIIAVAVVAELLARKKRKETGKILSTRKVAVIGVMSALAGVLMLFEIPLFFAPGFYKLDLSELPVLICGFAYGPVAGVLCEAVKILVKLVIKGTSTAFVGELANFVVGCFMILPATIIYTMHKTKKRAIIGCIVGTICICVAGPVFNGVYLIPKFAELFHTSVDDIVAMGTAVNPHITNLYALLIWSVLPLNLIKGIVVSLITILIYRPLRPVLKGAANSGQ